MKGRTCSGLFISGIPASAPYQPMNLRAAATVSSQDLAMSAANGHCLASFAGLPAHSSRLLGHIPGKALHYAASFNARLANESSHAFTARGQIQLTLPRGDDANRWGKYTVSVHHSRIHCSGHGIADTPEFSSHDPA
ncbi:MAG: hypothetical protein V4457_12135 [Pseudomonadota bacterium]